MKRYAKVHSAMLEQGVYLAPSGYEVGFLSTTHTEIEIDRTLEALEAALPVGWE
jgi:glutamate-1-semialdehyde 2,1-aminomutase